MSSDMNQLQADYLVVGSGAMGMAFTDVVLKETDKTVLMVDLHDRPGGHWNDAYPFVRLHQPSAFYGVNSRKLGNDTIDAVGWNAGLFELASGSEVVAYFDQVMREQFIPSGRVQYIPNCEYKSDGSIASRVSGKTWQVTAAKTVDATYMNVTVPSVTKPKYEIAADVTCVPLNELPKRANATAHFAVIGAGKTGMDACLWLLRNEVDPDRITWVMPRDSWMLDRANIQPGELAGNAASIFIQQMRVVAESESVEDLFEKVNELGSLIRFDDEVKPTMYRCATVTTEELEQLRRIKNVVRQGRVKSLRAGKIVLDEGDVELQGETLFVDCTADGLERRPVKSVFEGDRVTLQAVRTCQQVFSAAFIAHCEVVFSDEAEKNKICTPVPHPDNHIDFLRTTLANAMNGMVWAQYPDLQTWLVDSRLDGFSAPDMPAPDPAASSNFAAAAMVAAQKLQQYIAEAEAQGL
ncbi:MAG: hypothetical protein ACI9B8_003920 [Sulfitobacter sp.]|jgi:hypothetical protein